jgi:sugar transferase EpsL
MNRHYRLWGKRTLDIVASVLASPVVVLVGFAVAIGVKVILGPGVLFRQLRPGLGGQPFTLVKFRTMLDLHGPDGMSRSDSQRLTPFGRRLRAWSLDELPTLWNVLKGNMSLVGPRPLLMQYLGRYTPEQARRHGVRPGITGWAQVNGRNALSWEEKLTLDVWYVDNLSIWLDLRILTMTVWKVVRREGISAEGHATMPEFLGTMNRDGEAAKQRGGECESQ